MCAAQSLAHRPGPDSSERRKNLLVAGGVLGALIGLLLLKWLLSTARPIEVSVRGYDDCILHAQIEVRDTTGKVVTQGETDDKGFYAGRVPPGAYVVEAAVSVHESAMGGGLPNSYPQRQNIVVTDDSVAPNRIDLKFPNIEPLLERPGRFRIHK